MKLAILSHRAVAYAQIMLSVLYTFGYFALLFIFALGYVRMPVEYKDTFSPLLGSLTTGQGLILTFWFMRQRASQEGPSGNPA